MSTNGVLNRCLELAPPPNPAHTRAMFAASRTAFRRGIAPSAAIVCLCVLTVSGDAHGQESDGEGASAKPASAPPNRARQATRAPRRRNAWDGRHRIRSGDTLASIARRYRVSVGALQRHNRLRGSLIREGRQLRIPGRGMGRQRVAGARPGALSEAQEAALELASSLGLSARTGNLLLVNPPEARWIEAAGDPGQLDGTLDNPVPDGVFLRGWGSGPGGYHLALDIGARAGTPVLAAEGGLVLYAGNGIRGYGNVVILAHPNGWTTWYAHNHQNGVVPGQRVMRGEPIATVGQTGYARGPHLHFILVSGLSHCDARPLLTGQLRSRAGEVQQASPLRWVGDEKPDAVRCATRAERPNPRRRYRRRQRRR